LNKTKILHYSFKSGQNDHDQIKTNIKNIESSDFVENCYKLFTNRE